MRGRDVEAGGAVALRPARRARPARAAARPAGSRPRAARRPAGRCRRRSGARRPRSSRTSSRASGRRVGAQAPEPGVDEDHVDRVAGGVVQVAGDARALLGGGEAPLALGLALGAQRALLELGHPLADAAGRGPRPAMRRPRRRAPNAIGVPGNAPLCSADRGRVRGQQPGGEREREPHRARDCRRAAATKYSATVGPSGGPAGSATARSTTLADAVSTNTPSGARAAGDQRQRGERGQRTPAQRVGASPWPSRGQQPERQPRTPRPRARRQRGRSRPRERAIGLASVSPASRGRPAGGSRRTS